ncbi:272_t:CDS:2 [Ambispora gerdemannii]|uniref:272_t:CDS:1 n=1 Tax=Ambispora gerdemannii TaxID=144530 RepID=A0A9N8VEQ4_9GLOM|nr:272_t:CDS:2 [Ambispora gerdemannii]
MPRPPRAIQRNVLRETQNNNTTTTISSSFLKSNNTTGSNNKDEINSDSILEEFKLARNKKAAQIGSKKADKEYDEYLAHAIAAAEHNTTVLSTSSLTVLEGSYSMSQDGASSSKQIEQIPKFELIQEYLNKTEFSRGKQNNNNNNTEPKNSRKRKNTLNIPISDRLPPRRRKKIITVVEYDESDNKEDDEHMNNIQKEVLRHEREQRLRYFQEVDNYVLPVEYVEIIHDEKEQQEQPPIASGSNS